MNQTQNERPLAGGAVPVGGSRRRQYFGRGSSCRHDDRLRAAAFAFLGELSDRGSGAVSWHDLQRFEFEERRIPLVGQTASEGCAGMRPR
jgi:hypothetical protein